LRKIGEQANKVVSNKTQHLSAVDVVFLSKYSEYHQGLIPNHIYCLMDKVFSCKCEYGTPSISNMNKKKGVVVSSTFLVHIMPDESSKYSYSRYWNALDWRLALIDD
jgi:hypothetical protein